MGSGKGDDVKKRMGVLGQTQGFSDRKTKRPVSDACKLNIIKLGTPIPQYATNVRKQDI